MPIGGELRRGARWALILHESEDVKSTPEKKAAFCAALVVTGGNVTQACKAVDIDRTTPYTWCEEDPPFAKAWDRAKQIGCEVLEDEARRRAFEGCDRPVFYQGDECGVMREYSDTLAIFLLKGGMPEKYRERVELSGTIDIADRLVAARGRTGE